MQRNPFNAIAEVASKLSEKTSKSENFGNILAQTEQLNTTSISVDISSITDDVHPRLWILELGQWNLGVAHIAFGYYRKSNNANEMTSAQFVDNISAISSVSITSSTLTINLNNGWSYARLYVLDK